MNANINAQMNLNLNLNVVKGFSMVPSAYAWELDEIESETKSNMVEMPLIPSILEKCSVEGYGAKDPVSELNRHVYSFLSGNFSNRHSGYCLVVCSGFKKPMDFKKLHRYKGVYFGGVISFDVTLYGSNVWAIRKAFLEAERLAESGKIFIFLASKKSRIDAHLASSDSPMLLATIEKGEKPFSTALKRFQVSGDMTSQYLGIVNDCEIRIHKTPHLVGQYNNIVLNKSAVCSGKNIISSHKVLYCQIEGGERRYYAREIRNESPYKKLLKGFEEFIKDEHPDLIDELPSLRDRKISVTDSKLITFDNVSDDILLRAYEFMNDMVTYRFERQFIKMFPDMNSTKFIDRVADELSLDRSDVIDNINSAFNTDYTIDFVTGETITESEATYIVDEGYTMDTEGYVLCVNDDEYHEERSCTYYNGDWYTNGYFNDNFEYCHSCEDYFEVGYGCSCGGESCEDILLSSDDNVLDHCGYVYIDVDKDRETIKPELSFKKKGVRTYGLEIEFAKFNEYDSYYVRQETMILKSDGTNGVTGEINTLPFTFNALQDPHALDELWSYLERVTAKGGEGDVTQCGIHVHVSRDSVSDLDIAKFECLINSHHESLSLLARRDYFRNSYTNRNMDRNVFVKPRVKQMEKYQPVNYQHSKTFEIRIFRSNLRSDRVRACVEFVEFGLAFVKTVSVTDLKTKSFSDLGFLQALNRNSKRFKNLHELAVSKGLLDKKPTAKQA